MFIKGEHTRKKGSFFPFFIFRMFLSLLLLAVFGLGLYQAFKHFSGVDPIQMDPKNLASLLLSEESASITSKFLNLNLPFTKKLADILPAQPSKEDSGKDSASLDLNGGIPSEDTSLILKFAVIADSHNDNENLKKALTLATESDAKFVIGLGDYSSVGTVEELQKAKNTFEASDLPYYLTAGDHDLWNARDNNMESDSVFKQMFGSPYQSFADSNIRFVIVYNSDNYFGVDDFQLNWLKTELNRLSEDPPIQTFVFLHEPLYHPSSDHFMGKENKKVADQAQSLAQLFRDNNVGEVFAGDTHFYTRYTDPKTNLKMTASGALATERNTQSPRFLLVDVYSDGSYNIQDTEL